MAGDELRLDQILQNLMHNAIKYSPEGGQITIVLARNETCVSIQISDRGIGIPSEALPHLFNRFYRVEHDKAKKISGLGLGLYVVKEIISLHGGTIEVESVEDKGNTFTIRFPVNTLTSMLT